MIRIVTSEKLNALEEEATDLDVRCKQLNKNNEYLARQIEELEAHLEDAQRDVQAIKEDNSKLLDYSTQSDTNEVVLRISNDLTSITPIIRWRGDETAEKLIEIGMMKDSNNTKTATQIALMTVALDGLEQIVEDFQPSVQEE